jgi:hypothetical protein
MNFSRLPVPVKELQVHQKGNKLDTFMTQGHLRTRIKTKSLVEIPLFRAPQNIHFVTTLLTLSQTQEKFPSSFGNAEVISSDRRKLFINILYKTIWKLFVNL